MFSLGIGQGFQTEAIALLTHRFDATTFAQASLLELAAQGEHLGIHRAGPATEGRPGHPQQLLPAAHHPWGHQQGAEQGKFPRAQLHRLIAQGHLTQQHMHFQRTHADPLLQAIATAAQEAAGPCRQLLQAKGFAQHLISASIEQAHHGLRAGASGEHHHGTTQLAGKAQGRAFIQQFSADQQIGRLGLADLQRFAGRGHGRCQMAVLPQTLGKHGPQGAMGIHHQNPLWLARLTGGLGFRHRNGHAPNLTGLAREFGYQAMPFDLAPARCCPIENGSGPA